MFCFFHCVWQISTQNIDKFIKLFEGWKISNTLQFCSVTNYLRVVYLILLASLRRTSSLLHGKYNLHGWANFPRPVRTQLRHL